MPRPVIFIPRPSFPRLTRTSQSTSSSGTNSLAKTSTGVGNFWVRRMKNYTAKAAITTVEVSVGFSIHIEEHLEVICWPLQVHGVVKVLPQAHLQFENSCT